LRRGRKLVQTGLEAVLKNALDRLHELGAALIQAGGLLVALVSKGGTVFLLSHSNMPKPPEALGRSHAAFIRPCQDSEGKTTRPRFKPRPNRD